MSRAEASLQAEQMPPGCRLSFLSNRWHDEHNNRYANRGQARNHPLCPGWQGTEGDAQADSRGNEDDCHDLHRSSDAAMFMPVAEEPAKDRGLLQPPLQSRRRPGEAVACQEDPGSRGKARHEDSQIGETDADQAANRKCESPETGFHARTTRRARSAIAITIRRAVHEIALLGTPRFRNPWDPPLPTPTPGAPCADLHCLVLSSS